MKVHYTDDLIWKYYEFEDGEECSLGCKNHISHPCENCGRIGANGVGFVLDFVCREIK